MRPRRTPDWRWEQGLHRVDARREVRDEVARWIVDEGFRALYRGLGGRTKETAKFVVQLEEAREHIISALALDPNTKPNRAMRRSWKMRG